MLARHAEQVALVVVLERAVRAREQEAVAERPALLDREAAGDRAAVQRRLLAQPAHRGAIDALGAGGRLHREAGGEHLRQQRQRAAGGCRQQAVELRAIGRRVLPREILLEDRDAQILHSNSAARTSVSSCLAKQKRSNRSGGGRS